VPVGLAALDPPYALRPDAPHAYEVDRRGPANSHFLAEIPVFFEIVRESAISRRSSVYLT